MVSQNRLDPKNCNKAKCKTCIFGDNPIHLSPARKAEIMVYLSTFSKSHICHVTNKTCYGSLEYQAKLLHKLSIIPEPSVESLLTTAKEFLNKPL